MSKDEIKALIDSQAQQLKDAIDSLPSSDQQAEIDALKAEIEEKKSELASKSAELEDAKAKLASVDQMAKAIDAAIEDA